MPDEYVLYIIGMCIARGAMVHILDYLKVKG